MRPKCSHLEDLVDISTLNLEKIKENTKCLECSSGGPNLWMCLIKNCLKVGCGEAHKDHSTLHHKCQPSHCVHLNLSTLRLWCYKCESEVFLLDRNLRMIETNSITPETSDSDDDSEENIRPIGLTGLQNLGNTCYMNSALQALSNTPPLTNFFLECEAAIITRLGDAKPGLSRSYFRLIQDMWNKSRLPYIVPSGVLYGIRNVHPMFRGYQQHDTQEFLRCFMDQLHEELKEPVPDNNHSTEKALIRQEESQNSLTSASFEELTEEDDDEVGGGERQSGGDNASGDAETANASSQSEGEEYETCDSGVSERSSLSDEGERASKRRCSRSTSPQSDIIRTKLSTKSRSHCPGTRKKQPVKYRSIISDVFDGKVLSSVQCLTCDRVSTRIETFQDLSLPIPSRDHLNMLHQGSMTPQKLGLASCSDVHPGDEGWLGWFWHWVRSWFWGPTVSLHDCLAAFFSADELKGDNMYSCEKCNKLRNGVKYSKVLELPEVLCIHLKRFRHELMFSAKIANYVSFPLEGLDMRPYLHKECVSQVTTYDLVSVICHHGTAGGGHYTCFSLNCMNNRWFEFDDQYVTPVPPETVQNCEAYVLFYKKSSSISYKQRHIASELMESSRQEATLMQFYVSKQWINKLNTFAEPGPIDNSDFLCSHGGVHPSRAQIVIEMCTVISQSVWEYLYETYGGGPACNHLYVCTTCEQEQEALDARINHELEVFKKLTQEFKAEEHPSVIYVIAMNWFRQWQSFVHGKESDPPGPIDNSSIVIMKMGQPILKPGSDYAQLSEELWTFFHHVYGGGPELMLRSTNRTPTTSPISTPPPAEPAPSPWMTGWEQREPHTHTHKARSVDSIYLNRTNSTSSNPSTSRAVRAKRVNSFNFNVNNIARRRKMRDMGDIQLPSDTDGGEPNLTYCASMNELVSEDTKGRIQNESGEESLEEDESLKPISIK